MPTPYDVIARWYDAQVRAHSPANALLVPPLLHLAGELEHRQLCDLACGEGHLARLLAARGAQVTGVDRSAELLALARQEEAQSPRGITYVADDAQTLEHLPEAAFDGVVCHLALMDIPDLAATVQAVRRVLRPRGWFVFSLTHPCFQAPHARWHTAPDGTIRREVSTYFDEGFWKSAYPGGVRGQVGAYHRTLSTYMRTLSEAGFQFCDMYEPQATGAVRDARSEYGVIPPFLLMRRTRA
ncbi:ubiquinone biosynthesis O-methyltransferase, mitochondrial [Deinococcus carri]|uniref:Ubiquinone biosynthesis O-methyltransferase, mitochondrial n=1 Tax=Deinococcus carri TaxID=1211323 RepID=A0ABP9W6K8_9DEIO